MSDRSTPRSDQSRASARRKAVIAVLFLASVVLSAGVALRIERTGSSDTINLVWNIGWAVSAAGAGLIIEKFGFATPFYLTAGLYGIAAVTFWRSYRGMPEHGAEVRLSEEAKGRRGEGTLTD